MKRIITAGTILCIILLISVGTSFAVDIINGCVAKSSGVLRIVAPSTQCRSNEYPIAWNAAGPDLTKLYTKACQDNNGISTCACDNNDILISGGADCGGDCADIAGSCPLLTVSLPVVDTGDHSVLPTSWHGYCANPDQTRTRPKFIAILCSKP